MTNATRETRATLAYCFDRLTDAQLGNLLWHVEQKTPICCGDNARVYTNGKGGA